MPNDSFPCYCPPLPPLPSSLSLRLTRSSLLMLSGKSFQCSGSGRPEREKDFKTAKREEREEKQKERARGRRRKCRQSLRGGALLFRCSCSSCSRCVCSTSRHQPTAQSHTLAQSLASPRPIFPSFLPLFPLSVSQPP